MEEDKHRTYKFMFMCPGASTSEGFKGIQIGQNLP